MHGTGGSADRKKYEAFRGGGGGGGWSRNIGPVIEGTVEKRSSGPLLSGYPLLSD